MKQVRELVFYINYFEDFFSKQHARVKEKIDFVLFLLTHADRVPEKFLKHVASAKGLYEIRIEVGKNIFRVFCCFDEGKIVVLLNGFQKKSQKTPRFEITLALRLMHEYFNTKR